MTEPTEIEPDPRPPSEPVDPDQIDQDPTDDPEMDGPPPQPRAPYMGGG